jgi:hypothetical protein
VSETRTTDAPHRADAAEVQAKLRDVLESVRKTAHQAQKAAARAMRESRLSRDAARRIVVDV